MSENKIIIIGDLTYCEAQQLLKLLQAGKLKPLKVRNTFLTQSSGRGKQHVLSMLIINIRLSISSVAC